MRALLLLTTSFLLAACGQAPSQDSTFGDGAGIMGGSVLKETDPVAASVVGIWDSKEKFMCTGTLIADDIVLTAAHCVVGKPAQLKVVFGTEVFSTLYAREVDIQQEYIHPVIAAKANENYERDEEKQPQADQNDIAVIKFKGALPPGFKPAQMLKDVKELSRGVAVTVAGYGVSKVDVNEVNPKSISKKKLMEGVLSGEIVCDDNLINCFEVEMSGDGTLKSAQAKIKRLTESEVRLDESHGEGTCNGDSGGPAFVQKNGEYFLFGVTSRGNMLCNEEGVYTNAIVHAEWIQKTIQGF